MDLELVKSTININNKVKGMGGRVIIFGGFDMQPCHVNRLSKLYRSKNVSEVDIFCHPLHTLSIPLFGGRRALEVAEWMNGLNNDEDKIIHVFSGAAYLFARVAFHLTKQTHKSVKGIVFECSPMDCGAEQFGRFAAWRLEQEYTSTFAIPFKPFCFFTGNNENFKARYRRERMLMPLETKVHFIRCDDDVLIDPNVVDEYRRQLEKKGNITSETIFKNAGHCRAVLDCFDEYRSDVSRFVEMVWPKAHDKYYVEIPAA